MEINARHNRSTLLAVKCGINFPLIEYQHRLNGQIPQTNGYRKNVYWIDMTRDLATIGKYIKRGEFSLWGQLKPYLARNVFAVLSFRDPLPFIKRCADILNIIASAVTQRLKPQKQSVNNPELDA
jgi:predicted ATP-grasp superfamily ATP-dependent carboligase